MSIYTEKLHDVVQGVNRMEVALRHFVDMVDGDRLLVTDENRDELITLLRQANGALG